MSIAAPAQQIEVPFGTPARPIWRGRLHQYAFVVAVPTMATLIVLARSGRAQVSVVVYALGLCSMFGASMTYHRFIHTVHGRQMWQRVDHSMIYAAIAGSSTPICLLAMPDRWGIPVLSIIWAGSLAGMWMKATNWRYARAVGGVLYIAISWLGILAMPFLLDRFGAWPAMMLLAGGVFYTVGAIGFLNRWPRLSPSVFSYHEVWHAFTIIAAAAHLTAVWTIVT